MYISNFTGKTEKSPKAHECVLKDSPTTSVLSTLMTYVNNISNWPDPGGQIMDMNHNYF